MKKARVMSTISMVIYILSLLILLIGKVIYYTPHIQVGFGPVILREWILLVAPLILGNLLLIFGVKLAAKNKAWVIYPIGFLVLMIPFMFNILGSLAVNTIQALLITLATALPMIIALLLLALEHFIRPRVKVMGILGAALMLFTMTALLMINAVLAMQNINIYPNANGPTWLLDSLFYHIGYQLLAVAALLFVIGCPPRANLATPAPQPVYPSYGYQQPQTPQYNSPQQPQYQSQFPQDGNN